mmetsp:Transcript_95551/g.249137  ORF Transcript_95551/g.249137 Transcript_95551/m.249137 type:complete len:244 (+) Transcript_95551:85-816(+)
MSTLPVPPSSRSSGSMRVSKRRSVATSLIETFPASRAVTIASAAERFVRESRWANNATWCGIASTAPAEASCVRAAATMSKTICTDLSPSTPRRVQSSSTVPDSTRSTLPASPGCSARAARSNSSCKPRRDAREVTPLGGRSSSCLRCAWKAAKRSTAPAEGDPGGCGRFVAWRVSRLRRCRRSGRRSTIQCTWAHAANMWPSPCMWNSSENISTKDCSKYAWPTPSSQVEIRSSISGSNASE